MVKEYCKLVFPNHKFTFVEIDNIDGEGSGPGYSALKCKEYLQRPFYITTCDCIIDSPIPHLDGNWLGVQPTSYPEKYSTILVDGENIVKYSNKSVEGYDLAFIGLAGIWDYKIFWEKLEKSINNGELVSAFESPLEYPTFKIKKLKWLDTGNLDDLNKSKQYFNDKPLSLQKDNNEITYREGNLFIKFTPEKSILQNRIERAKILNDFIPPNFNSVSNFIYYNWKDGNTLYEMDDLNLFRKFLNNFEKNLVEICNNSNKHTYEFYKLKTLKRFSKFIKKNGEKYYLHSYNINGKQYPELESFFSFINYDSFNSNPFYKLFHGDLQFDNIIYNSNENKFTYIDWRESFGGYTPAGDVYYDLAKLYGGCIIPYDKMKDENNINYIEGEYTIKYSYEVSNNLSLFKSEFENWVIQMGFDLNRVKFITGLIFLNMSPLHDEKFSKMLWFKSIEMLYEYANK